MPRTPTPRTSSGLIVTLRNFLVGRKGKNPLRYEGLIAARTQPPPDLPEGPAHRLFNNYYYLHDARREMIPPVVVVENSVRTLASGTPEPQQIGARKIARPGNIHQWD